MKISSKVMAAIVIAVIFGGIAFTTWMGWWATETSKEPARYNEGEATGQYNPADIRGSYSFGDVSELFDIPIADLQTAFQLPAEDPASVDLKSLETLYGDLENEIGTASVRLFVARYKELPYEPTEETYLFAEAVAILKDRGTLTDDQRAYLEAHSVILNTVEVANTPEAVAQPIAATLAPTAQPVQATPEATVHAPPERKVTGSTTFQYLLDWGVKVEDIEKVLGGPMPAAATIIKDHVTAQGSEFSTVKNALQALVDQAQP